MKTFLAFVTACLFWPSAASAQGPTAKEQAGLIGPVKSVEAYHISFTLKDGKTKESKRESWYSDTYNIDGNKTEHVFYLTNGTDKYLYIYDTGKTLTKFEYDSRGNWTRETRLVQSGNDKPRRYHAVERVITYH